MPPHPAGHIKKSQDIVAPSDAFCYVNAATSCSYDHRQFIARPSRPPHREKKFSIASSEEVVANLIARPAARRLHFRLQPRDAQGLAGASLKTQIQTGALHGNRRAEGCQGPRPLRGCLARRFEDSNRRAHSASTSSIASTVLWCFLGLATVAHRHEERDQCAKTRGPLSPHVDLRARGGSVPSKCP